MKAIKFLLIIVITLAFSVNAYSQAPLKKKTLPNKDVNKSYNCYKQYMTPNYSNRFYYNNYFQHNALVFPQPVTIFIRL